MRKLFVSSLLASMALAGIAGAQVLSTTAITDQFTTGAERGNGLNYDLDGSGAGAPVASSYPTNPLGTEYTLYQGADATPAGGIKYINTYAGDASPTDATNKETPVVTVGAGNVMPDRGHVLASMANPVTLTANTRPGAASPNEVIIVGDDGGQNCLIFGDDTSTDYYVQADVLCLDRSALTAPNFESVYVAIRACRNDATPTGGALTFDREQSYAMYYDSQLREIRCIKTLDGITSAAAVGRGGAGVAFDVQYGTTQTSVAAGWHTFRVQAVGGNLTFSLDGTVIATATDGTPIANGRGVLGFREGSVAAANEVAGVFDNLQAGPASASVSEWSVY